MCEQILYRLRIGASISEEITDRDEIERRLGDEIAWRGRNSRGPKIQILIPGQEWQDLEDYEADHPTPLVCPQCHHGDELRLIETCQVERELGDVTTNHTEYLELAEQKTGGVYDNFSEIGIACGRCDFRHIGDNWKAVLEEGVVK